MAKVKKVLSQQELLERSKAKSAKFVELANKRVPKAIGAIQGIANLSHTGSYTYTQEQVTKIFEALTGALKDASDRFSGKKTVGGFQL